MHEHSGIRTGHDALSSSPASLNVLVYLRVPKRLSIDSSAVGHTQPYTQMNISPEPRMKAHRNTYTILLLHESVRWTALRRHCIVYCSSGPLVGSRTMFSFSVALFYSCPCNDRACEAISPTAFVPPGWLPHKTHTVACQHMTFRQALVHKLTEYQKRGRVRCPTFATSVRLVH